MEKVISTKLYDFLINENNKLDDVVVKDTKQSVVKDKLENHSGWTVFVDLLNTKINSDLYIDALEFKVSELEEEVSNLLTKLSEQDRFIEENRRKLESNED